MICDNSYYHQQKQIGCDLLSAFVAVTQFLCCALSYNFIKTLKNHWHYRLRVCHRKTREAALAMQYVESTWFNLMLFSILANIILTTH